MINAEKMSKSTGNFMTMVQAIQEYGADATRLSLADAGDGLMDANFGKDTANATILRLTKEETWIKEVLEAEAGTFREGECTEFMDRVFECQMNQCIETATKCFEEMKFHDALVACYYDMGNARDQYRVNCR